jgi:uncharacterized membrane protein YbaN (DUF454 family)
MERNRILSVFLTAIGLLSLALGLVGIVVPLLPTTPFLLLSAACFSRSSLRLHRWLLNHRVFGLYIRCYREYKAITVRTKVLSISLLWGTLILSAALAVETMYLRIILLAVGTGVTVHLLRFKTLTSEMLAEIRERTVSQGHRLTGSGTSHPTDCDVNF